MKYLFFIITIPIVIFVFPIVIPFIAMLLVIISLVGKENPYKWFFPADEALKIEKRTFNLEFYLPMT